MQENQAMAQKILAHIPGEEVDNTERATLCAYFLDEVNQPIGAVMYYGYSKHNVFVTLAIFNRKLLTKQKFHRGLSLAFESPLNVYRITALVAKENKLSQKLVERLGFHKEGESIGLRGTEDDVTYIYRYTQKDWYGSKFYGINES
jgi:hypothetical protein